MTNTQELLLQPTAQTPIEISAEAVAGPAAEAEPLLTDAVDALDSQEVPLLEGSFADRARALGAKIAESPLYLATAAQIRIKSAASAIAGKISSRKPDTDFRRAAHAGVYAGMAIVAVARVAQMYAGAKYGAPTSAGNGEMALAAHVNATLDSGSSTPMPNGLLNALQHAGETAAHQHPNNASSNEGLNYMTQAANISPLKSGDTVWGNTMDTAHKMGFDLSGLPSSKQSEVVDHVLKYNRISWDGAAHLNVGTKLKMPDHETFAGWIDHASSEHGGKALKADAGSPYARALGEASSGHSAPSNGIDDLPKHMVATPRTPSQAAAPNHVPQLPENSFDDGQLAGSHHTVAPKPVPAPVAAQPGNSFHDSLIAGKQDNSRQAFLPPATSGALSATQRAALELDLTLRQQTFLEEHKDHPLDAFIRRNETLLLNGDAAFGAVAAVGLVRATRKRAAYKRRRAQQSRSS